MNIALIGSGGRENAFAHALSKSSALSHLYILPGNPGTAQLGTNMAIDTADFNAIADFCLAHEIKLLLVGPEEPLVKGLRDFFEADEQLKKIAFVGPGKDGAIMEGSKDWSKLFMQKYQIPTAAYQTFTAETIQEGFKYIQNHTLPIVLKADGLAAGKGVLILNSLEEALREFEAMLLNSKFGNAGNKVVIEEFLSGIECSVFVLSDGNTYKILPVAKDYKRIGEGDTGLNTGGMGALSPVPFADDEFMQKVETRIVIPTIEGLKKEGIQYKGFIFIGLIKVNNEPYVIEYNCRMGDPETEVVLPRIQTDMLDLMLATANGTLSSINLSISNEHAATVMLVAKGYPEAYEKGTTITGLEQINQSIVYHAGTKLNDAGELLSNGGRVMALTSLAPSLQEAIQKSNAAAELVQFSNKYYRTDIGFEFN